MTRISGWGRAQSSESDVVDLTTVGEARELFARVQDRTDFPRGVTFRGLGRSYGDASINSGGTVAVCTHSFQSDDAGPSIHIDTQNQRARVSAGVSIEHLLRALVPAGFFVPVTPGTRYVTVGGAIASDIHGKNHHIDGAFGQHVSAMTVMLSNGEKVTLDPVSAPEWFWATVGGMGLTGMVLDATIDLIPITSNLIEVTTQRTTHIDELFAIMGNSHDDDQCRYSVAWVDMLSKGDSFGRGVLTRGNHAQLENVARDGEYALEYDPRTRVSVPRFFPNGVLNAATIRVFNELWFRKAPASPTVTHESITGFFHPLDGVRHWNRMYGSKGFLQYQCVVPLHATHVLKDVISMMQQAKIPAFLAVLKRMGPANPGLLSFPMEGWTLAVDIAVGAAHLSTALSEIDEVVISAGGRHYLAKDAHMTPSTFERGYPQLNTWRSIQREMDPRGIWTSDLDRRLCVVGAR